MHQVTIEATAEELQALSDILAVYGDRGPSIYRRALYRVSEELATAARDAMIDEATA
jgi:hypothetical protein